MKAMQVNADKYVGIWVKPSDNLLKQVGRRHSYDYINLIVADVVNKLKITQNDTVLDLCCGNGLITKEIANYCKEIHGVDFSKILIETARKKFNAANIHYHLEDATNIDKIFATNFFDKCYSYFSFQFFDPEEGRLIIKVMCKITKSNGLILVGDVPDKRKIWHYYDTLGKKIRFLRTTIVYRARRRGEDSLGWWWHPDQIKKICKELELECKILQQNEKLPHAHYRFDFLIKAERKSPLRKVRARRALELESK
jgi:ubiquinone/menaquinone biosynthesis C-methylase UbiE